MQGGGSRGTPLIHLRSFLSGQDAKKDDAVRKAYKYLAALHEVRGEACLRGCLGRSQFGVQVFSSYCPQNCSQLIQTIEDTGTIMREVRDLEEQVSPRGGRGNQGGPVDSSLVCAKTGY